MSRIFSVWQAGQGPTITSDRHITAFLPVNPKLSAVHNQARQKLARLHPGEFAALIADVLCEVRRRQTGLERSPTLETIPLDSSSSSPLRSTTETHSIMEEPASHHEKSVISAAVPEDEEDGEPLYDTVTADEDYVDAKDDGIFGGE